MESYLERLRVESIDHIQETVNSFIERRKDQPLSVSVVESGGEFHIFVLMQRI